VPADEALPPDRVDHLSERVSDGQSIDWPLAESASTSTTELASVHALRDLERILEYHRKLQSVAPQVGSSPAGADGRQPRMEQWGDLAILELASTGANGEVWRAWDAWLQREVALKFLQAVHGPAPDDGSESALLEESRALARVRHSAVVVVHGIAEHDGRVGMWMELLRGRTLAAEIERRGALPALEVARIGLELCRALEAVESVGLVHRDVKPANIVLEPDGRVVLTDFGLGQRWALVDGEVARGSGTPLFMSPGMLSGEPATPRSDLYALGVTLRWALTGHAPFQARTLEELKIEAARGPSRLLRAECPTAPEALVAVIDRAMAPEADARYTEAHGMAVALESAIERIEASGVRRRRHVRSIAVAASIGLAAAAALWLLPGRLVWLGDPRTVRFEVSPPPHMTLDPEPDASAVSPDGRVLAFVAIDSNGTRRLWLRPLESPAARVLEGTEDAAFPFWSPDSRNLGFFASRYLKKIAIDGGAPEILCPALDQRGASWGNGVIVFASMAAGPLFRISSEGGDPVEIMRPDTTLAETALRWPEFLPDGKHFLCVALPPHDGEFTIYAGSIASPERKRVLTSSSAPVWAGGGDLILASNGRLMSQHFDEHALKPVGRSVSLGNAHVSDVSVGERLASASHTGVLLQSTTGLGNTQLVWLSRSGRPEETVQAPMGRYENLSLSPDGTRIAAVRRTTPTSVDLWLIEPRGQPATRFTQTTQTRIGGYPAWSPDGTRLAFSSSRSGPSNIYQKLANGAGNEEVLFESGEQFKEVVAWSPDGRYLVFEEANRVTSWDLWLLPLAGDRKPIPYLCSNAGEVSPSISPDGRWAAYSGDETGKNLIYVRSFPTPGAKHLIPTPDGDRTSWSRDGRELIVFGIDRQVWSVPITLSPTFRSGTPRLLFRSRPDAQWLAVTSDHRRFLEAIPSRDNPPNTILVSLNWRAQVHH
jgi:serine/threonine protein kinase/Tol biopolymer transport system component